MTFIIGQPLWNSTELSRHLLTLQSVLDAWKAELYFVVYWSSCRLSKNNWEQSLGHGPQQTWGSLPTQTRVSSQRQISDLNSNTDFIIKEMWVSRSKARHDTHVAHQTRAWVALRFASNASMWAPRSHSDATLWSLWAPCLTTEGGLRPMWDPLSVVADPRYWVN